MPAPARAKKAPRLKIRAGGVAGGARGTKVVFDADGTPRLPLEALARSQAEEEAELELARCVFELPTRNATRITFSDAFVCLHPSFFVPSQR